MNQSNVAEKIIKAEMRRHFYRNVCKCRVYPWAHRRFLGRCIGYPV